MPNRPLSLLVCALAIPLLACDCDDGGGSPTPDGGPDDAERPDAGPGCFTAGLLSGEGEGSPLPDGIGGEGDLEIVTDTLRAVFAAPDRPVGVAASGGTLMDLHLVGQSDHMNELSQLAGISQGAQVAYTEMAIAEMEGPRLVVEVRGHVQPQPRPAGTSPVVTPDPGTDIEVVTRYEFRCGERRVWMDTSLTNTGEATYETSQAWAVMDVMFWGQKSLEPFCPSRGHGDACPPFDIDNPLPGLVESVYIGSTGSLLGDPGSFAFYVDDPEVDAFIGVHDAQVSAFGAFALGANRLRPGESRTAKRVVVVGDGADAASAVDLALEGLAEAGRLEVGTVRGALAGAPFSDDPHARPLVVLATPGAGGPVDPATWIPRTMVRVRVDGSFEAKVPAGAVSWEARAPGALPTRGEGGTVAGGESLDLGEIVLDELPLLEVRVRDGSSGAPTPLPARIVVLGVEGTETPSFGSPWGDSPARNVILTDGMGDAAVHLPPGTYDVYATHGPWYTLARARVTVVAGLDATASFELLALPVIPDGFLTADFHVHSGASYDSSIPMDARVRAFLAEGVDALVSTEHDVIFDLAPALAAVEETLPLAWQGRLATFVGLESTATVPQPDFVHTIGHHNAFPLTPIPGAHKNGAPNDEYVDVGTLYELLRALPSPATEPMVQLNHARAGRFGAVWLGYFDTCGLVPTEPIVADSPCFGSRGPGGARAWDFDAMEVINGTGAHTFVNLSRDWHALLRQADVTGRLPIGTANSDTHALVETAGYPVTVLRTDTSLAALDDAALVATLGTGSVAGAFGVFAWASARESGTTASVEPGRTPLSAPSGAVVLSVRVAAAPWIPVEEIRIRVDGEVVVRLRAADGDWAEPTDPFGTDGVVRFDGEVDLSATPFAADGFITVEAGFALSAVADLDGDGLVDATDNDGDGDVDEADLAAGGVVLSPPPALLSAVVPGGRPMAFTNPIYVDRDGNGTYDASLGPLP